MAVGRSALRESWLQWVSRCRPFLEAFWLGRRSSIDLVPSMPRQRGAQDILVLCANGLTGIADAGEAPHTRGRSTRPATG